MSMDYLYWWDELKARIKGWLQRKRAAHRIATNQARVFVVKTADEFDAVMGQLKPGDLVRFTGPIDQELPR